MVAGSFLAKFSNPHGTIQYWKNIFYPTKKTRLGEKIFLNIAHCPSEDHADSSLESSLTGQAASARCMAAKKTNMLSKNSFDLILSTFIEQNLFFLVMYFFENSKND